jgi:antitoxin HicB
MPALPRVTGREIVRALTRLGWVPVAPKGSHVQLKHPERGGRVTVPIHAGETIGPTLLRSTLVQAGVGVEEFRSQLWHDRTVRTYTIVVEPEPTGGFMVVVPALPGCFTQGRTVEECRDRAAEAIAVHIAGLQTDGEPVPNEVGAPQLLSVTVASWFSADGWLTMFPARPTGHRDAGTANPNRAWATQRRAITGPYGSITSNR